MAIKRTEVIEEGYVNLQESNNICSLQTSSLHFVSWFMLLWYPDTLQSLNILILNSPLWRKVSGLIFYSWSAAVQGE